MRADHCQTSGSSQLLGGPTVRSYPLVHVRPLLDLPLMNRPSRPKPKQQPQGRASRKKVADEHRLQKVLAAAGIGSRRECEELILEGRVEVDREVVVDMGVKVDPVRQQIRVDGVVLTQPKLTYYAVNKPVGVVCTNSDPSGRTRVVDLINSDERLFTVGRLDRTSEGLILVTNDGELTNRLTHPRFGVPKTYLVTVVGHPTREQLSSLRRGVHLAEGVARVSAIRVRRRTKQQTELEIVLNEGRNREIRRLLARIRHKVVKLKRVAIGHLHLQDLPSGAYRKLKREDIARLFPEQRSASPRTKSTKKPRRVSKPTAARTGKATPGKPAKKRPASSVTGSILTYDDEGEPSPARQKKSVKRKASSRDAGSGASKSRRPKSAKSKPAKKKSPSRPAKAKSVKPKGKGKGKAKKGRR